MSKQCITFLVVGDRRGMTRKFAVPLIWLKVAFAIFVIGVISCSAVIVDYFSLVVETSENNRLRLKNIQIKEQVSFFARKTRYFRR